MCPFCKSKTTFKVDNISENEAVNRKIKNITCDKCNKHIWNSLETQRTQEKKKRLSQPPFITGEGRSFSSASAVEDAIKKSVQQFMQGVNNLLIVVPNMFAGIGYGLMAAMDRGYKVKEVLKKYDKREVISAVLILDIFLPAGSKKFKYVKTIIAADKKVPPKFKIR